MSLCLKCILPLCCVWYVISPALLTEPFVGLPKETDGTFVSRLCGSVNTNSTVPLSCLNNTWFHVIQKIYSNNFTTQDNCSSPSKYPSSNKAFMSSDDNLKVNCIGEQNFGPDQQLCNESIKEQFYFNASTGHFAEIHYECINDSLVYNLCDEISVDIPAGDLYVASPSFYPQNTPQNFPNTACSCRLTTMHDTIVTALYLSRPADGDWNMTCEECNYTFPELYENRHQHTFPMINEVLWTGTKNQNYVFDIVFQPISQSSAPASELWIGFKGGSSIHLQCNSNQSSTPTTVDAGTAAVTLSGQGDSNTTSSSIPASVSSTSSSASVPSTSSSASVPSTSTSASVPSTSSSASVSSTSSSASVSSTNTTEDEDIPTTASSSASTSGGTTTSSISGTTMDTSRPAEASTSADAGSGHTTTTSRGSEQMTSRGLADTDSYLIGGIGGAFVVLMVVIIVIVCARNRRQRMKNIAAMQEAETQCGRREVPVSVHEYALVLDDIGMTPCMDRHHGDVQNGNIDDNTASVGSNGGLPSAHQETAAVKSAKEPRDQKVNKVDQENSEGRNVFFELEQPPENIEEHGVFNLTDTQRQEDPPKGHHAERKHRPVSGQVTFENEAKPKQQCDLRPIITGERNSNHYYSEITDIDYPSLGAANAFLDQREMDRGYEEIEVDYGKESKPKHYRLASHETADQPNFSKISREDPACDYELVMMDNDADQSTDNLLPDSGPSNDNDVDDDEMVMTYNVAYESSATLQNTNLHQQDSNPQHLTSCGGPEDKEDTGDEDFMIDNVAYESLDTLQNTKLHQQDSNPQHLPSCGGADDEDFMIDNVVYESSDSLGLPCFGKESPHAQSPDSGDGPLPGDARESSDDSEECFMIDNPVYESSSAFDVVEKQKAEKY